VPEAFDEITSLPTEQVEVARMGVALQALLHLQRQAIHASAHVGVTGGDPHPDIRWDRDHRRARNVALTIDAGADAPIVTRTPPASSTTIAGAGWTAALSSGGSSTITAGTNSPVVRAAMAIASPRHL
jgi:hypothetical protein